LRPCPTAQLAQVPPYLNIQFMRFFYKQETQQKAKILRKVCAHAGRRALAGFCRRR
jgi:hypothetical protein